jgi:outer membrane immunogenic protein
MKRFALALTATAVLSGQAVAADMPTKAYVAAPAAYSWTGCYIGVHAGGGTMKDSQVQSNLFNGGGGVAGGQVGCNYQVNQFVFGLEGEGWWSNVRDRYNSTENRPFTPANGYAFNSAYNSEFKNKWDAAISVRAGYAYDRVLIYGKAGAVVGGFDYNDRGAYSYTYLNPANNQSYAYNTNGSGNLYGILLGMGLEWAFMGNWTTKIEADYIIYGNGNLNYAYCSSQTFGLDPTNTACGTRTQTESATKLLVKIGLNYKFGNAY